MKRVLLSVCLLFATCTSTLAQDFTGVLNGAPYKVRVPESWNGTLVLYSHMYYLDPANYAHPEAAPGGVAVEDFLLSRGYALAGSVFRGSGWQVKEGTRDLVALSTLFDNLVGKPSKRILVGASMGSVIALKSAEEVPLYDGVIPICSIVGSIPAGSRDYDFAYGYSIVFGWPSDWGTAYDVRDDLNFIGDVLPTLLPQLMDPANFGKFEFLRLVLDLPLDGFYAAPPPHLPAVMFIMAASTEVRAEIERRAKGPVYGNAGRTYSLTPEEKAYLASLGVDPEGYLAAMNAGATVRIENPQQQWAEKYFDPTGDFGVPVLAVHSVNDHWYPPYFQSLLRDRVLSASAGELFLQVYTEEFGHCTFTQEQVLSSVQAMESWLDTGTKPDASFFPETMPDGTRGFLPPGYDPPPWPTGTE